jgi:hypothetical protein
MIFNPFRVIRELKAKIVDLESDSDLQTVLNIGRKIAGNQDADDARRWRAYVRQQRLEDWREAP